MIRPLILLMGLVALSFLGLAREGGKLLRRPPEPVPPSLPWPRVSMIVPADGFHPAAGAGLASLVAQDYPAFELIFVTATRDAPNVPFIREAIETRGTARHVVSGPAARCGQKNHNLLAGIEAADPDTEILVFCDAGRTAPAHFLKALVAPIVLGRARVSSGYHHLAPQTETVTNAGRAATVLVLYLTRGFKGLIQPWGGATAIRRSTFNELKIGDMWAQNIVDDVSLSALLNRYDLPARAAPGATLITSLAEPVPESWTLWLTRQLLFLKFCRPGVFLAAGAYFLSLAIAMISAGTFAAGSLWGHFTLWQGSAGFLFLLFFLWTGWKIHSHHPRPFRPVVWLAGFSAIAWTGCRAFVLAAFSSEITWMKTRYRIGRGGRVRSVL